jgi:hypothetical protein
MIIPAPKTWVDGEIPSADTLNKYVRDPLLFLLNPPMVMARSLNSATLMANITWSFITYDYTDYDNDDMFDFSVNTTRFVPKTPGYYMGYGGVSWAPQNLTANSTGRRIVAIYRNGIHLVRSDQRNTTHNGFPFVQQGIPFGPVYMNGTTDRIEVAAWHDAGAGVTYATSLLDKEHQPTFYMRWVRGA